MCQALCWALGRMKEGTQFLPSNYPRLGGRDRSFRATGPARGPLLDKGLMILLGALRKVTLKLDVEERIGDFERWGAQVEAGRVNI